MRKLALVVAVLSAAAGLSLAGVSPTDAAGVPTSDVFAVHGLNLNGQTAQGDGGTPVTVCVDDTDAGINPFEFGQVAGPIPVPTGASVNIKIYGGTEDCTMAAGSPLINKDIPSVPAGTVALVATQGPQAEPDLTAYPLNVECVNPGEGHLTAAHAAAADTVDVLVDGSSAGMIAFGETLVAPLPAGTVPVQVNLSGNPIVGPLNVEILEANNRIVYVVGGSSRPIVPLIQDLAVPTCLTDTDRPPPPEPASDVVEATPTFTG